MPVRFDTLASFLDHGFDTVIDVRSPAEYAEDHIPGAISLPAMSNAERARVGTIYTQESPFRARKIGAAIVARNVAAHLEGPLAEMEGGWRPLVYCWRGGQRSGSVATILSQIGWRTETVEGGYRSYRRLVAATMHDTALPHRLILLDGNTGTAKTELLHRVAARGVQVVDLEGLARHRGSLFGAVAAPQPAQKAFESALAAAFARLDPARPVLVEAESSKIGELLVPPSVWAAMRAAPALRIAAPLEARARYLARAYADLTAEPDALAATLDQLIPFQGRETVAGWQALAAAGEHVTLADQLMQQHYDPRYAKWRARQESRDLAEIAVPDLTDRDLEVAADRIAETLAARSAA
ncbi:tRNA 2-selenouridine(34) synthase MnmH [Psychromarinibacter sp. C21-152]|uniref:tRNA 2-selenouridine(34) synthase MnmH n=1 Tax=Psychromarinibacter sediminicola TaxID=3033385 RepID=A0AAE3NS38_9RHOB|nr:tRNA 2-selenouridine(34) synthase MnmH [Psychromarinibacter sediminicola]MDF0601416.1 tRNA 2-selenouridine(34) synthase MnmH [Psychromarinibacter sediminicola]